MFDRIIPDSSAQTPIFHNSSPLSSVNMTLMTIHFYCNLSSCHFVCMLIGIKVLLLLETISNICRQQEEKQICRKTMTSFSGILIECNSDHKADNLTLLNIQMPYFTHRQTSKILRIINQSYLCCLVCEGTRELHLVSLPAAVLGAVSSDTMTMINFIGTSGQF